jgi:hypothetical protein
VLLVGVRGLTLLVAGASPAVAIARSVAKGAPPGHGPWSRFAAGAALLWSAALRVTRRRTRVPSRLSAPPVADAHRSGLRARTPNCGSSTSERRHSWSTVAQHRSR